MIRNKLYNNINNHENSHDHAHEKSHDFVQTLLSLLLIIDQILLQCKQYKRVGGNYRARYLKYKYKYLELKKINILIYYLRIFLLNI